MAEGNKPTPVTGEGATASAGVLVEALRRLEQANDAVAAATTRERYLTDLADVQPALLELDDARAIARQALSASTATAASDGETLGPLWRKVQQVHTDAMSHDWSVDSYRLGMAATLGLSNTDTPDRFGEGYRAGVEAALERARHKLGHVTIEAMGGDNLAVTLCTVFDDADGEQDDNGWTEAATQGCDATLAAIHEVYATAIRALHPATGDEA